MNGPLALTPLPLNQNTLGQHAARVAVPGYDRSALTPSVVHMSVGSFHRSHQAVYFDDLAQRGVRDWGLVGVGLHRPEMRDVLTGQDGLYTVVSRGHEGDDARVVGVIIGYAFAQPDGGAVLDALTDPRTRLVTLTITGSGYKVDADTGRFDAGDPDIRADLAHPGNPRTAIGYLVEALDRRRRAGGEPFTVLSCDNMPDNGVTARTALTAFARLRDPRLAAWIEERVAFPSSMVDRITPQTTVADRRFVEREFGVSDRWPVITEPFSQWIVEDAFCNGRPPLDRVGVQFVDDVRPYALMKTRLLNASHCALGYLGWLAGHRRTDEAMADPAFDAYISRLMDDEVTPLLPAVPGIDLTAYKRTLRERFANPQIGDELARLCRSGSTKMPVHVLSSLAHARAEGRPHGLLTLAVAAWIRYLRGVDEDGLPFVVDDPLAERLTGLAVLGGDDPRLLLEESGIFGALGEDELFADELGQALEAVSEHGARAAMRAALVTERTLAA